MIPPTDPQPSLTPEGESMRDFPGSLPVEKCRRLLLMLHHELTTLNGLHVTDRPEAMPISELSWRINEERFMAEIDDLLELRYV